MVFSKLIHMWYLLVYYAVTGKLIDVLDSSSRRLVKRFGVLG